MYTVSQGRIGTGFGEAIMLRYEFFCNACKQPFSGGTVCPECGSEDFFVFVGGQYLGVEQRPTTTEH